MAGLISFMNGTAGRVLRVVLGLVIILVGVYVFMNVAGTMGLVVGLVLIIVGFVPVIMGIVGRCLLEPLAR
ncbi:MAG: DUF2892 domain-containing protein [Chloroflexi bacterium]|nr:DUF2892 domain-containing protein [Chloroflexota bacterium]MBU1748594.1 DUF2892 domain-containing protein [Chloroflexota bacterium]MBU1877665.1 DUF2892 domain-containing protein [Chloroflexota bacterium]